MIHWTEKNPFIKARRAIACVAVVLLSTLTADAAQSTLSASQEWLGDYREACDTAIAEQKMLLIHVAPASEGTNESESAASESLVQQLDSDAALKEKLDRFVLLRLDADATIIVEGEQQRLLDNPAFAHLQKGPGVALVDYRDADSEQYGRVVSALPFRSGKYYRWSDRGFAAMLDLPDGSITQRTMVWAVRTHSENPQSTTGEFSPEIASEARKHSEYQARIRQQGHQQWGSRSARIRSMVGQMRTAEVVAQSWPGQTMLDSCIDCVRSWRHSSGHWGQVKRSHDLYAYDLRQSKSGIWYGTGIFAD